MTRGRALGGLAAVVVLIAAAAFLLLREDDGEPSAAPTALTSSEQDIGRASTAALPRVEEAGVVRAAPLAAVVAEPPPADEQGVPESYLLALGGLQGRILEERPHGEPPRPVPDFRLELLGSRQSALMTPLDALGEGAGEELRLVAGSATTDAEGRFLMSGLEPRVFGALVLDPGGPRSMLHLLEESPVSGKTRDVGDIVLPLTVTLTGTVVDEHDNPVPGARVRATDLPLLDSMADLVDVRAGCGVLVPASTSGLERDVFYLPPASLALIESRLPFPTARTDAEGRFVLTGVPAGLVALAVDDGLHRPFVRSGVPTGAAGGTRDVGRLALADGLPLAVRVKDGDGQPVPAAEVMAGSITQLAPVALMKQPARTTDEGVVEFLGLSDREAWVAGRADPRHEYTLLSVQDVSVGLVTLVLPAQRTLRVTVRDTLGVPVPGVRFHGRQTETSEVPDIVLPPRSFADRTKAGEEDGQYLIEDLSPGRWELTALAEGYTSERTMVDLDATSVLGLTLRRGSVLRVRVVGALDGAPVEYARVEAWGEEGQRELDLFNGPTTAARTDAGGLALLRDLPEGEVRLQVSHPAWAVLEERAEVPRDEELLVTMPVGGSVAGQVTDAGGPPAEPLFITLESDSGAGDDELPRFTLSDLDGKFRFDRVAPGEARLRAMSRAEFGGGLSFFETFFNSPLARAEVQVLEGAEAQVELVVGEIEAGVETGYLRGSLSVNGLAAPGWRVRTWGAIRRSTTTDENGAWDLGRIEAGEVNVMLNAPGQAITGGWTEAIELELQQDERKYERIELRTGAVTGRVVLDSTGAPASAAEVRLRSDGEEGGWGRQPRAVTSADGSFRFEPVVVGNYRVTARVDGYAETSSEGFELHALELRSGITLRLPKGLSVSGRVQLPGIDAAPRFMRLVAKSETGSANARVDLEDMSFRFDALGPGTWTIHLASDLDGSFQPQTLEVSRDMEDVELAFALEPEQEGEAQGAAGSFVYEVK